MERTDIVFSKSESAITTQNILASIDATSKKEYKEIMNKFACGQVGLGC